MRALLVDDQVWLRSALRLILEHEANIQVIGEVGHIQPLPSLICELRPDLLLLDWQLPGLGVNSARHALLGTMRSVLPRLYVIALTNDHIPHGELLDADAFINKAEPPRQILTVLQQARNRLMLPNGSSRLSRI